MAQDTIMPSYDEAYNTVYQKIHAHSMLTKLAAMGFEIATEQDANDYLRLAGNIRDLIASQQVKQANARVSRVANLNSMLEGATGQQSFSYDEGIRKQAEDNYAAKTAAEMAQNPEIYNSLLTLLQAQAEKLN